MLQVHIRDAATQNLFEGDSPSFIHSIHPRLLLDCVFWFSLQTIDDIILDFSEAQAKIKEDENRRRVEEGLTVGLTKEVSWLSCFYR